MEVFGVTQVIQCDACGGSVVFDAGRQAAQCLFCGSVAVHADDGGEAVLVPDAMLPFEVSRADADARFRGWARSSWWYAAPLRRLSIELHELLLPVWRFDAALETHWAGLVSAVTRSGARPQAGVEHAELTTLVPASMGLHEAELQALQPFREGTAVRFDPGLPHEVPALTERAAAEVARGLLTEEHRERIVRAHQLKRCRCSVLVRVREARLSMVPIYIGSFRYRDRPWRFVINGQTGRVTGKAPLDRVKLAVAIGLVIAVALVWLLLRQRTG
jgi:ribosomal protein S27E